MLTADLASRDGLPLLLSEQLSETTPDTGSLEDQGTAERRIIECRRLRAPAEVARQLALRTGDPLLLVKRVLAFSGTPTILEDIWLPGGPFKGLTQETLAGDKGPMYALFEAEFGVRMVRAVEKLKAVGAEADAELLQGAALDLRQGGQIALHLAPVDQPATVVHASHLGQFRRAEAHARERLTRRRRRLAILRHARRPQKPAILGLEQRPAPGRARQGHPARYP